MKKHVFINVYAPLMSFGNRTSTDYRPSDLVPTKSSMGGLICASMGIKRKERTRLQEVHDGFLLATKVINPGAKLTDFQTIQAVKKSDDDQIIRSRKQELEELDISPIITHKEYVEDAVFVVAIRPISDKVNPKDLVESLQKPHFPIYFGRRCCVPSGPLHPRIVEARTFEEAFQKDEDQGLPDELEDGGDRNLYLWEGTPEEFKTSGYSQKYRNDQADTREIGIVSGPYNYNKRLEYRAFI